MIMKEMQLWFVPLQYCFQWIAPELKAQTLLKQLLHGTEKQVCVNTGAQIPILFKITRRVLIFMGMSRNITRSKYLNILLATIPFYIIELDMSLTVFVRHLNYNRMINGYFRINVSSEIELTTQCTRCLIKFDLERKHDVTKIYICSEFLYLKNQRC